MSNLQRLIIRIYIAFLATVAFMGFVILVTNLIVEPEAVVHATFGGF